MFNITTTRNHVRQHDASVQRDADDTAPLAAHEVANEVDLLLALLLGPETDTADEERPVNGYTSIRM